MAFRAAIWFYMTPQPPKPSMHDIATGYWIPNSVDKANGFYAGFGATINVLNGAVECGHTDDRATNRVNYYKAFMNYFKVSTKGELLSCDT
jgi:hypothetical protein